MNDDMAVRRPRIAFALEQVLGHVSQAQNIRRYAPELTSIDPNFIDINFHKSGGLIEGLPVPAEARASIRARLELRDGLKQGMPDAFVFNTQKVALFCPDYLRIPSVITLDVTPVQYDTLGAFYDHQPDRGGLVARAKHAWNRRLFRAARRILPASNWAAQSLVGDYGVDPTRVEVLPPGIDVERWTPGRRDDDGRVRILFVGGNFDRKGGPMLLDWFQQARPSGCELHLVTRDPVPSSQDVCVYNDMQNNSDELMALAQRCDIFALPTLADCFSLASMEAMGAGLPVVTTSTGGIADIVDHGRSGFLVEPGDTAGLAHSLDALVADRALRDRMGAAGRTRAESRFNARTNVARLVSAVLELLPDPDTARSDAVSVRP